MYLIPDCDRCTHIQTYHFTDERNTEPKTLHKPKANRRPTVLPPNALGVSESHRELTWILGKEEKMISFRLVWPGGL